MNVPAYTAPAGKTPGSLGLTVDVNAGHAQLEELTNFVNDDLPGLLADAAPIIGRTLAGVSTAYATAQLAAAALRQVGGLIVSQVDILGPLVLEGNTSLYAPGRRVYLSAGNNENTLTLANCFGTVEVGSISRDTAGTGSALQVNYGSPVVRANVHNTQGYNAIFSQHSTLAFTGNAELTNNPALGAGGERIAVLAVEGQLRYRGDITITCDNPATTCEALTAFSGAEVDFSGTIRVANYGTVARNQGARLRLRGTAVSGGKGVKSISGQTDLFISIDTRTATPVAENAPLSVARNAATPASAYVALHAGTELLAPAGVPSIYNANAAVGPFEVQTVGALLTTTTPAADVTIVPLTLASGAADPRRDLATFSGARTNTLVFEGKYAFSAPVLGPNCQSFQAQVIKAATAPATAAGPARAGTPAQILAAINADFATLTPAELALVYVRFISVPVIASEEAHLILTALPA